MKSPLLLVFVLILLTYSNRGISQNIITTGAIPGNCNGTANFSDYSNFNTNWTWAWYQDTTLISTGNTTLTNLCEGDYQLVLDSMGVQISESFTITNFCSYFTYTSLVTNCTPGNCDGGVNFIPNGTGPYTYSWSNGSSTQSLINLCPGLYNIQCNDANGCIVIYTAAVIDSSQQTPIIPNLISTNDLTNNCSATASVSPSGGSAPYTYLWNTGSTTNSANFLCAGTYSVTIWDNLYTDTTINFVVTNCSTFSWGVNLVNCTPYPLGSCDGGINFTAYGGTPPYSYLWSNGDTTQNLTNACPGPYSVEATDAIGCTTLFSSGVFQDTLYFLAGNLNTVDDYASNCTGSASVSPNGGTAPYVVLWSTGQTTNSISNLCAGIYSVTVWDQVNDSITIDFIIADSSTTYGNNPYPNGSINDTLYSDLVTNCIINYNVIDSASLYQAVYNASNQSLYVTWAIYSPTDTIYISDTLGLIGNPGYYSITISVFCPNKSGNDFFKVESVIYFDGSNVWTSTLQVTENPLESVSIYPNPFTDIIKIDNQNGSVQSMRLTDLNGRITREKATVNSGIIEFDGLESIGSGTYFLILSGEKYSKTYKLIK